jgi:hypothetical protein
MDNFKVIAAQIGSQIEKFPAEFPASREKIQFASGAVPTQRPVFLNIDPGMRR